MNKNNVLQSRSAVNTDLCYRCAIFKLATVSRLLKWYHYWNCYKKIQVPAHSKLYKYKNETKLKTEG